MLWIDSDDAQERINAIENNEIRGQVQDLRDTGFTVIKDAIPEQDCDELVGAFNDFCEKNPVESSKALLVEGFRSRLYNLHGVYDVGKRVAFCPKVMDVLDEIFSAKAALNSTLFFEQGSQQNPHRDTPFFTAVPYTGEYVGVWFALEDVAADAGPLTYFPGAHKFQVDLDKARFAGNGDPALVDRMFANYNSQILEGIKDGGYKGEILLLKKGDAAIWHPELPHGGSEIKVGNKSRRSLVAHYIPQGAYIQNVGYFFGLEPESKIMEFCDAGLDRSMRWVTPPIFMPNQ